MMGLLKHMAILSLFFSISSLYGQTSIMDRNAVYAEFGTLKVYQSFSMNYERILLGNNKRYDGIWSVRVGGGKYLYDSDQGPLAIAGMNYMTGKFKSHHLEGGFGISAIHNMKGYNEVQTQIERDGIESIEAGTKTKRIEYIIPLPYAYFGYRYMKRKGKLVFKVGVGIPEAVSVGFGFKL